MANVNCRWGTMCLTQLSISSVFCALFTFNSCCVLGLVCPNRQSFLLLLLALRTLALGRAGSPSGSIAPHKARPLHRFHPPLCSVTVHFSQELNNVCDIPVPVTGHTAKCIAALMPSSPSLSTAVCNPSARSPCCFCMVVKSSKVRVRTGGLQKA